jgi:FkbM family methyltransferase
MVNTMRRPLLLRVLPAALRQAALTRLYEPELPRFRGLYDAAFLHFAPTVSMRGIPGDLISDAIAFTGVYDLHCTRWLAMVAREEGGTFVDVGANTGYFSFVWLAQQQRNRAVAFEPVPRNIKLLQHNVAKNGFQDRIGIHSEAAGSSSGLLRFDAGPVEQTGWGGFADAASSSDLTVPVVTLDQALANTADITVLKIDIQGAELWALRGAQQILRTRRVRHVWWEENKARMKKLGIGTSEVQDFMRDVGYDLLVQGDPAAAVVDWYARPQRH